ncbi:MAG: hypothetical protein ACTJG2_03980 [Candidatus Saccharimonadales bacterium]
MQLNNTTNISDDQELAQALAGVNKDTLPFEETQPETISPVEKAEQTVEEEPTPAQEEPASTPEPEQTPEPAGPSPVVEEPLDLGTLPNREGLDSVKIEAINELRPLIDKLTIPAEEKFDTYLLLIRTTDDQELVAPAHEVAKQIEDESRRAMALLDIIKEIDYLSNKTTTATE